MESMFSNRGRDIPRGLKGSAVDAAESPESGRIAAKLGAPVWRQFVNNKAFQENNSEVVKAEQAYQGQVAAENKSILSEQARRDKEAQRDSAEKWGGENGKIFRQTRGGVEEYDAAQYAEDPNVGGLARKSLFDREVRGAKAEADERKFKLSDPTDRRGLSERERKEIEDDISLFSTQTDAESQALLKERRAQLAKADERLADEKAAFDAESKLRQYGGIDADTWYSTNGKKTLEEKRQAALAGDNARGREVVAADESAAAEMRELDAKIQSGVSGAEVNEIKTRRAELAAGRAKIAEERMKVGEGREAVRSEAVGEIEREKRAGEAEMRAKLATQGAVKLSGQKIGMLEVAKRGLNEANLDTKPNVGLNRVLADNGGREKGREWMVARLAENAVLLADPERIPRGSAKEGMRRDEIIAFKKSENARLQNWISLLDAQDAEFAKAGVTDPAERERLFADAVKENEWTASDADNVRKLSTGEVAVNPARIYGQYDRMVAEIKTNAGSEADAAEGIARLDSMRAMMAEQKATDAWYAGFGNSYRDHESAMVANGVTDKVEILDAYAAKMKDRNGLIKFGDALITGYAEGGASIYKTGVGGTAGIAALVGADGVAATLGAEQKLIAGAIADSSTSSDLRGQTGGYGLTKELSATVTQMAPMFIGGAQAQALKGMSKAVVGGLSVYGWAAAQGYESKLADAVDIAQAEAGDRQLTPEEIAGVLGQGDTQAAAFLNGAQTAILAKVLGKGVERAALGQSVRSMTVRDFLSKGGREALKDSALRKELVKMGKTIFEDATDEFVEEGLNQFFDGIISTAVLDQEMLLGDLIEESVKAGAMGAIVGGGIPQVKRGKSNQPPADPLSRLNTRIVADDPGHDPASEPEVEKAREFVQDPNNVDDVADAVLAAREIDAVEFAEDEAMGAAEATLIEAQASGDPAAVKAAEGNLETVRKTTGKAVRACAVLKLTSGGGMADLTDAEARSIGFDISSGTPKPLKGKDLEAQGLTKPLIRAGADGSAIVLDEALKGLEGISPRVRARVQMTESQAIRAAAKAAADAANAPPAGSAPSAPANPNASRRFTVGLRSGSSIEVEAMDEAGAEQEAAAQANEQIVPGSATAVVKESLTTPAPNLSETPNPLISPSNSGTATTSKADSDAIILGRVTPQEAQSAGLQEALDFDELESSIAIPGLVGIRRAESLFGQTGGRMRIYVDSRVNAQKLSDLLNRKNFQSGINEVGAGLFFVTTKDLGEGTVELEKFLGLQPIAPPAPAQGKSSSAPAANPKAPGAKAKARVRKYAEDLKKGNPRLANVRISEDPKIRAQANEDGSVDINLSLLVDEAMAAGMNEGKAAKFAARALDEEIRHMAQYAASRKLYETSGSALSYEAWRAEHYGRIWKNHFLANPGKAEAVAKLYGKEGEELVKFNKQEDWRKAFEAIRMMSQGRKSTEAATLWANISQELRAALEAALEAMKSLVANPSPTLKAEIAALEEALAQIKSNEQSTGNTGTDGKKPAQGKKADGNSGKAKTGSNRPTGDSGKANPTPSPAPAGAIAPGTRVTFTRKGEELSGVVGTVKKDGTWLIVELDRPTAVGLVRVTVKTDEVTAVAAPASSPATTPKANDSSHRQSLRMTPEERRESEKSIQRKLMEASLDTDDKNEQFRRAGYQQVDGFWVHPHVDPAWVAGLSPETKARLKEGGILFFDPEHQDSGRMILFNDGTRGMGVKTNAEIGSDAYTGKDETVLHELGHHIWQQDLDDQQRKDFADGGIRTKHGQEVASGKGRGEGYASSLEGGINSVAEEDFAQNFAENGGDLGLTLAPVSKTENPGPQTGQNPRQKPAKPKQTQGKAADTKTANDESSMRKILDADGTVEVGGTTFTITEGVSGWSVKMDNGSYTVIMGRPYPPGAGYSRREAMDEAVKKASFPAVETPATTLSEADQALLDAMEGLFTAPLPESFTEPVPTDRIGPLVTVATKYLAEGADTPAKLAEKLGTLAEGKMRKFSQSIWFAFKMAGVQGAAEPDWAGVYGSIDKTSKSDEVKTNGNADSQPNPDPAGSQAGEGLESGTQGGVDSESGSTDNGAGTTEQLPDDGSGAGESGDSGTVRGNASRPGAGSKAGKPRGGNGSKRGDEPGKAGTGSVNAGDGSGVAGGEQPVTGYRLTDPERIIGAGGPKARFARNRLALETFDTVLSENRQPTPEEQDILASYIGWGSFGQELFQGTWERPNPKPEFTKESEWLRDHLGKEGWESIRDSIINAHYTDPPHVQALWRIVDHLGFKGGRVLEPSMGIGSFFGLMPDALRAKSSLTGIELDTVVGGMAKMLYPDANIRIMGYEKSATADGFYDLVIGNWPFASEGPSDPRYNSLGLSLHDYFFVKALDQVRPGGLVIGITSSGTMDKKGQTARRQMARRAELVAAFRFPSGAFEKYAGTKVVTDVVILKKRSEPASDVSDSESWMNTEEFGEGNEKFNANSYWKKNPRNVLGVMGFGNGTTQGRAGMIVERLPNYAETLAVIEQQLPKDILSEAPPETRKETFQNREEGSEQNSVTWNTGDANTPQGFYIIRGEQLEPLGNVFKWELKDDGKTAKRRDELQKILTLKKSIQELLSAQRDGNPETEEIRKRAKSEYDAFVKAHGAITKSFMLKALEKANDPMALTLENIEKKEGKKFVPRDILLKDIMRRPVTDANGSIEDAFAIQRNQSRELDIASIAEISGKPEEEVISQLVALDQIYQTPTGQWESQEEYLGGNVRRKLREAKDAQSQGIEMERNIKALEAIQPKDVAYFEIEVQMGASWIPKETYAEFAAHLLNGTPEDMQLDKVSSGWNFKVKNKGLLGGTNATATWGTASISFSKIFQAAMNGTTVKIYDTDSKGVKTLNEKETELANKKIDDIREELSTWIWSDSARTGKLASDYNEVMNSEVVPKRSGSHLRFEGLSLTLGSSEFDFRQHQKDAVWRFIMDGRGVGAHEVGTGKTFTMAGLAVEGRRLGVFRKSLVFAHNANSESVFRDFQAAYPGGKFLYIDNLSPANRDNAMRQIATDEWDAVIVPHSLIDRFALREETLMAIAQKQILQMESEIADALDELGVSGLDIDNEEDVGKALKYVKDSHTAKELVKTRNRIIKRIKDKAAKAHKDNGVFFEDLGIDSIMVDEAHMFKKINLATRKEVKGLNKTDSARGWMMGALTDTVKTKNNGKGVYFFTGTPLTNNLNEAYNMMRFVMDDAMADAGIDGFDDWFNAFAASVSDVELTTGGTFEPVSRLLSFINVPELARLAGRYFDVVQAKSMPEFVPRDSEEGKSPDAIGRPFKKVRPVTGEMTPEQKAHKLDIQRRYENFQKLEGKAKRKAMMEGKDTPIQLETEGIKAALDMRMVNRNAEDHPDSKVNMMARNAIEHYQEDETSTQMIFMERGWNDFTDAQVAMKDEKGMTRKNDDGKKLTYKVRRKQFNLVRDMVEKLVAQGVKPEEIAIFSNMNLDPVADRPNDVLRKVNRVTGKITKEDLAARMRTGEIRFAIGSTQTMGTGVNAQTKMRAMHHLDAPWTPGEFEQRNGRGHRQGNEWNTVFEYRYFTEGSHDGRRWQVLLNKVKFISRFTEMLLDAGGSDLRVLTGDGADLGEEGSSVSDFEQSFSTAAGDPRILVRAKLRTDVDKLERKKDTHFQSIARAQGDISMLRRDKVTKSKAIGELEKTIAKINEVREKPFAIKIDGKEFTERKAAEEYLAAYPSLTSKDAGKIVADFHGIEVAHNWSSMRTSGENSWFAARVPLEGGGHKSINMGNLSVASLESNLRGQARIMGNLKENFDTIDDSIASLEEMISKPFTRQPELDAKTNALEQIEVELSRAPQPAPAWLRNGVPLGSLVYLEDGKAYDVAAHRWDSNGWWVLVEDSDGMRPVDYRKVMDDSGGAIFEEVEFVAPDTSAKKEESTEGDTDTSPLQAAPLPALRADSPEWKAMSKEERMDYLRRKKEGGLNAAPLGGNSDVDRRKPDEDGYGDVPDFHTPTTSEWARFKASLRRIYTENQIQGFRSGKDVSSAVEFGSTANQSRATRALAELFGRRVVIVDSGEAFFSNGYVATSLPELIFLNKDANRPLFTVAGHELWHHLTLDRPKLAEELKAALRPELIRQGLLPEKYKDYAKSELPDEMMADFLAESFTEKSFWDKLRERDASLFTRTAIAFSKWLGKVGDMMRRDAQGTQYFRDVAKAQSMLADVIAEWARNPTATDGQSKVIRAYMDSPLYAAPLTPGAESEANVTRLRMEGRRRINQPMADEARKQQELFKEDGKVVGAPRLANPGDTDRSRGEQDIVDALYEHDRAVREDRSVIVEARRRMEEDPRGVEEKLLQAAYGDGMVRMDDSDHVAARLLINQRAAEAGNDLAKHESNMALRMAYRMVRADTARELRIGRDLYKTPEERALEYITDAIYQPSLKVEKKLREENWSPQKKREYVRAESKARLAQIEKALKGMGVTLDEITSGQAFLSLSQEQTLKASLALRTAEEQYVIKLIQKKWPISRIRKATGFPDARIQEINAKLYAELMEKAREKARAGVRLENYRDKPAGMQAAPLNAAPVMTEEEIEAEARRIVEVGFGISPTVAEKTVTKRKVEKKTKEEKEAEKADRNSLTANWARPVFTDGLNSFEFNTKDRAEIMQRAQAIRDIAAATGKISTLTGKQKEKALKLLAELNAILGKYGTDANRIFESGKPVDDYRFDIRDRAHVAAVARAIRAVDADVLDKGIEWTYSAILGGLQTMIVNAGVAIPAGWDMTMGRAFEASLNLVFRDPMAASFGEAKYILKAAGPTLARSWTNAVATWGAELPMFEEDFLGKPADLDKLFDGKAPKMGVISGKKGRIIRIPTRLLMATDDFNRTAIAVMEVGAMAYRLARAQGMKPGSPEFDRFLKIQVNTPGSFAGKLAAEKASHLIFTNALPGQKGAVNDKTVPIEGLGDVVGAGAAALNRFVTMEVDSLLAKSALAFMRLAFVPFQRTPFNLIRRGVRHTLNPISLLDIAFLTAKNSFSKDAATGKWGFKWNADGRQAEIIERSSQQLQGGMLMLLLYALGAGDGDEDDLKKWILFTGTQPWQPKKKAELAANRRTGIGAYRISFRTKNGKERFGFNYGRIEPLGTTLGLTIDSLANLKKAMRGGKGYGEAALSVFGGTLASAQEKTYLAGLSDFFTLAMDSVADDEFKLDTRLQQFAASRVGMVIPNFLKQPIRETDPYYRDKAGNFIEELFYQVAPATGIKEEKITPYGEKEKKTGTSLGRVFDVTDSGTNEVNPVDEMLLRYESKNPGEGWFPSDPIATYTDPRTGERNVKMTPGQTKMFRETAGLRATALLKREALNLDNPTERDKDKAKAAFERARADAKKLLLRNPKWLSAE